MPSLRNRLTAAAVAGAAMLVASAPSYAQTAESAVRALLQGIDASAEWNADFGQITPQGNGVTVSNIRITGAGDENVSIELGNLTVAGYSEPSGGGFRADEITVDLLTVVSDAGEFELANIELVGLGVPDFQSVIFDSERPLVALMQGYSLAAAVELTSGHMDEMVVTQTSEGITSVVTYENFVIGRIADGKLDVTSAGPVTADTPSPEGLVSLSIASIESRDMDIGAIARVLDPSQYENGVGDQVWHTVLGLARYRDMVVEAPGTLVRFSDITVEDFRMRQPASSYIEFFDAAMSNPDMSDEEMAALSQAYLPDILSSVALGRLSIDNLDVEAPDIDLFRLGEFYIDELSAEGIGEVGFGDVEISDEDEGSFALDSFSFGDLRFPPLSLLQQSAGAGSTPPGKAKTSGGAEINPLDLIPTLGFLEIAGVTLDAPEFAGSLERFFVRFGGYVGFVPTGMDAEINDLTVDVDQIEEEEVAAVFEALGYDQILIDVGLDWNWREVDQTLTLRDFSIGIDDVGSVSARLELRGLTREAIENLSEETFLGLEFVSATLTVDDDSITSRAINMQAEQLGITPDQFREQIKGAVPFFLMVLQDAAFQGQIAPTLQAFIDNPGSLTMTLRPKRALPLMELLAAASDAPQRLPSLLSVEIQAAR
ncbi:MAG: hypothetical protein IT535_14780 [Bauldia sp.]|nr:hypothetical protein [Bauldia sp.]